jgi:hypothetical protein
MQKGLVSCVEGRGGMRFGAGAGDGAGFGPGGISKVQPASGTSSRNITAAIPELLFRMRMTALPVQAVIKRRSC